MIGYIHGTILHRELPSEFLIQVQGLGYIVFVNASIFGRYQVGDEISLYTYQYVREDLLALYGFLEYSHVRFFTKLLGVSGVGPKSALNIFEVSDISSLIVSIIHEDSSLLTKVSGIGRKTAQRIILELKTQLDDFAKDIESIGDIKSYSKKQDVLDALVGLGYSLQQAEAALAKMPDEITTVSEQITYALKNM